MSYHIFIYNGKAAVLDIPKGFSTDNWGTLQERFVKACNGRDKNPWVTIARLYPDQYKNGVYWTENLAGPNGIAVDLFPMPEVTDRAVKDVRGFLCQTQDVVRISARRPKEWLPLGSVDFQVEATAKLK